MTQIADQIQWFTDNKGLAQKMHNEVMGKKAVREGRLRRQLQPPRERPSSQAKASE
ncbi:unnamed protein product, partial [Prorocentrum cordatum]